MNEHQPPRAPQPLDYPSPPLSPYDRPIEPFVTFARRFKFAIRLCYLLFALIVIGAAAWGALRLTRVFDQFSE
ncbi:MAG TPA: hypothetical protein VGR35_22420 [Tepidisphaeraceae bacterium]|nr:hypothetical protein [Tepidisphaeraceae bacterium]